jgi:hypothetical protein
VPRAKVVNFAGIARPSSLFDATALLLLFTSCGTVYKSSRSPPFSPLTIFPDTVQDTNKVQSRGSSNDSELFYSEEVWICEARGNTREISVHNQQ